MPPVSADLVLRNGPVWCGLTEGFAEAVAVWQGRVLATGTAAEIDALIGPGTRVIDLKGRLATPGLNDSHLHLISVGLLSAWVDARPAAAPTLESLLEALRAHTNRFRTVSGCWRGAMTRPTRHRESVREELDAAVPDHPVMLVHTCGHVAICNSKGLALAGIDENSPPPPGSLIEKQNGRLTGLLAENAMEPVYAALPPASEDELVAAIERGGKKLLSYGITSCMDAAVGMQRGFSEIAAYHRAKREGRLPVRTWLTLLGDPGRSIMTQCHAAGLVTGTGDDMLMTGAVKIFLDGSASGTPHTLDVAPLSRRGPDDRRPHAAGQRADRPGDGLPFQGLSAHLHAIGNAAIDQLIKAYEQALDAMPDEDRRHRIEHCGFSTAEQHARMVKAGIYPCPQQVFIYDFGDAYRAVLGDERALSSYPLKTWMDLGLKPATGSQYPVCDANPFPNLYTMLTRKTWKGTVMDEGQCVSLPQALPSPERRFLAAPGASQGAAGAGPVGRYRGVARSLYGGSRRTPTTRAST